MIAALYVETNGVYFGLVDVDPWDEVRDARCYAGPNPVVAHPPCQRWGRMKGGGPSLPGGRVPHHDEGCFAAAMTAVRNFGGVLEHPKDSSAWDYFGLMKPPATGGWVKADAFGGWTCCVDQGHYGHFANKRTWLYAVGCELPSLVWGKGAQKILPVALERHGYERARRIGMMAMVGGKDKTRIRNMTPEPFRDLLISMARSAGARLEQVA